MNKPIPVRYIREDTSYHRIKVSTFLMILSVSLIMFVLIIKDTHAGSFDSYPYNSPPRIVHTCQQGFVGYDYSPRKEQLCKELWGMFTREILLDESDYFSKL